MEPFEGLSSEQIHVVSDVAGAKVAYEELSGMDVVGFDTESKPVFFKGQVSEGPHVFQFSTREKAFIFQSYVEECRPMITDLLNLESLKKIGFGLRGDFQQIQRRFAIRPASTIDLDRSFRALGYSNPVGAKSAIAILFNRKLKKSKTVTTSNWAATTLSPAQLLYAANDAYAALMVYEAMKEKGYLAES